MNPSDLQRDNAQYLWHPMAHPRAMKAEGGRPDIIARGAGCWVWDADGHKIPGRLPPAKPDAPR